jgi:ADP-heptose:LPS heptosyltransferase
MSSSPSVLIVRLDAIGDALTTAPLVAALRRNGYRVSAVLREANAGAFASDALERVHCFPGRGLTGEIARRGYGCALIATEKPEAYRLAYAARIPVRIGFENGWGKPLKALWARRLCTKTVFRTAGLDPRAPHECAVVFRLAASLIPDAQPPRDPAVLRPLVLDAQPAPDDRVAVQITQKWTRLGAGLEAVAALVARLCAAVSVQLIGAAAETSYCETIRAATGIPVTLFDSLARWKESIAASRALVAPDSGASHVAGMTGTPAVVCFAREKFVLQTGRWAPWAAPYRIVEIDGDWPIVAADALQSLLTSTAGAGYRG